MKNISRLSVVSSFAALLVSTSTFAAHANYKAESYKDEPVPVAVPVVTPLILKDGFYAGIGLGYDSYKVRQSLSLPSGPGTSVSFNPQLSVKGWNGSLFAGYGQYYDRFYIAGEIFVNGSSANGSYTISAEEDIFKTAIDVRPSYGLAILPGFRANHSTLLYARLGYIRTQFKTQETDITNVLRKNASATSWENGINYGVGVETAVYPCVSVRGEYTYSSYGSFRSQAGTKFSPSNNQFVLGAIYHFA